MLRDGARVELRLIHHADRELIRRGFARLSAEARYRRFFAGKGSLSEAELRYFTDVDHIDHFALIAISDGGEALGTARGITTRPGAWECAATVIDAAQGRGLGSALVRRLAAAATERNVRALQFDFLAENVPMRRLLAALAPDAALHERDGVIRCELNL